MAAGSAVLPAATGRRYGAAVGWRASAGLATALSLQQCVMVRCIERHRQVEGTRRPDLADTLTLSRGVAAAWLAALCASGVRDRKGIGGRMGWGMLLWGETASDWLACPLARRRGGTRLGSALDLEADSWLTLWAAMAAVCWGDLRWWCALAPWLRYLLLIRDMRVAPGAPARAFPCLDRMIGVTQMGLITAALCPWSGGPLHACARRAAPLVAAASLSCIAMERIARRRQ